MNMRIAGYGIIPLGEYEYVTISGNCKLDGLVECKSFTCDGACKGVAIDCVGDVKFSGSGAFIGNLHGANISSAGSLSCGGDMVADGKIDCAGRVKCKGSIKCNELTLSGCADVGADIQADCVEVHGSVSCGKQLKAEKIEIKADGGTEIDGVCGGQIKIGLSKPKSFFKKLPLIRKAFKGVYVKTCVEGKDVALDYVRCPKVVGENVTLGDECEIELVQYTESLQISPKAKVGKSEKI